MRAVEPLPFVPVMWMTGIGRLRVAEHIDEPPHALEGQVLDPARPGFEVDVLIEPGERLGRGSLRGDALPGVLDASATPPRRPPRPSGARSRPPAPRLRGPRHRPSSAYATTGGDRRSSPSGSPRTTARAAAPRTRRRPRRSRPAGIIDEDSSELSLPWMVATTAPIAPPKRAPIRSFFMPPTVPPNDPRQSSRSAALGQDAARRGRV